MNQIFLKRTLLYASLILVSASLILTWYFPDLSESSSAGGLNVFDVVVPLAMMAIIMICCIPLLIAYRLLQGVIGKHQKPNTAIICIAISFLLTSIIPLLVVKGNSYVDDMHHLHIDWNNELLPLAVPFVPLVIVQVIFLAVAVTAGKRNSGAGKTS